MLAQNHDSVGVELRDILTHHEITLSLKIDVGPISEKAGLITLLDASHSLVATMNAHIDSGLLRPSPYLLGSLRDQQQQDVASIVETMRAQSPKKLEHIFQNPRSIQNISATHWSRNEIDRGGPGDAMINMVFEKRCGELPIHSHPLSDRVIFVLRGSGYGFFCGEDIENYDPDRIGKVAVRAGDVLCYSSNTLHTFGTIDEPIELLTYHSKFFPFEDEKQYSVLSDEWTPSAAELIPTWPRPIGLSNMFVPQSQWSP